MYSRIRRFGVFELDLSTGELGKRGIKLKFEEQPFRLLAALLESCGELVTRKELRSKLWPTKAIVQPDLGLNKAMTKLRCALGDSADNPRFIKTLRRRGYRFTAMQTATTVKLGCSAEQVTPEGDAMNAAWREAEGSEYRSPVMHTPSVLLGCRNEDAALHAFTRRRLAVPYLPCLPNLDLGLRVLWRPVCWG